MVTRRDAVKSMIGGSALALNQLGSLSRAAPVKAGEMPMGVLGRTGVQVSRIGLGTGSLGKDSVSDKEARRIIDQALDAGINYVDTAPNYTAGQAERRTGVALQGKRDKVFLVSKTESDSYEGTKELLEQSLKHLKTDYLDMVHLHNFGSEQRWPDLDKAFSDDGAMGALREAKKKGQLRFIGASGHVHPSRFHYAIDSGEIDALMLAVNYVNQHTYDFEHKIWGRAQEKNLGLLSMKVFGGRTREGTHRLPSEDYELALRYTLGLPGLSSAVIGFGKTQHLDQLLETFGRATVLSDEEDLDLAQRGLQLIQENKKFRTMHGTPVT